MMKKIMISIITVILVGIVLFLMACPRVNDMTAEKVSEKLASTTLPERTEIVEQIDRAGKLCGNGNGMQFFGAILLKSELTQEELDQYYEKYRKESWEYVVAPQVTEHVEAVELEDLSFTAAISEEGYYIVYTWGTGVEPFCEFDLRGN